MRSIAIILGSLLLAATGHAQQVVGRPLFYVHSSQVYQYGVPLGLLSIAKDWSVTTDGTTSSIVRYGAVNVPFGPAVQSRLGKAPGEVFGQLAAALAATHVGSLAAGCIASTPGPGESYRIEMTWYGKAARVNTLVVASDLSVPCSARMQALLEAVASFERAMVDPVLPIW
jgi:hypothetical protein